MKSSFVEQLGPRVRLRAVDLATSGSSARVALTPERPLLQTVTLARLLIRRGVAPSLARDVAEQLARRQVALVTIPFYEQDEVAGELARLGVSAQAQRCAADEPTAARARRAI